MALRLLFFLAEHTTTGSVVLIAKHDGVMLTTFVVVDVKLKFKFLKIYHCSFLRKYRKAYIEDVVVTVVNKNLGSLPEKTI